MLERVLILINEVVTLQKVLASLESNTELANRAVARLSGSAQPPTQPFLG